MAVTVVGQPKSVFPQQIFCSHCEATLNVDSVRDIEHREDGPLYNTETVYGVECPVCHCFAKAHDQVAVRNEYLRGRKK